MTNSTHTITTREDHLSRLVARYFAKRHNGSWFKSATRVAIRQLRDERNA